MFDKLKLKDFGIHTATEINFSEGINCIVGKNRSGKTQSLEGISFALFGKTQNSKLEKIINFDADKAIVELQMGDQEIIRSRTQSASKLDTPKKLELDTRLNIDYQEYLSLFYISSNEQKSLFDTTYLRNFLISIFDLEKYAKICQKLKIEYKLLQEQNIEIKQRNKDILKKRFHRVKGLKDSFKVEVDKYEQISTKINKNLNIISSKLGELKANKNVLLRQEDLLKKGKCYTCNRPFDRVQTDKDLKNIYKQMEQLNKQGVLYKTKQQEHELKATKCNKLISKYRTKLNRSNNLLVLIKERVKEEQPQVNLKRIKELEQIIPIFDPKGFPSYLLNIYIPVITQTANQLLSVIFPDTNVAIRTERPESNKPDFKPFIKRGENELELSELSGSERVLVNLCFRLGVMIIYKRLNTTCLDTLIWDEGFGKIDEENTLKILNLLQNCLAMGFLKQIILVTHKDILKVQDNINYIKLGYN